LLFFPNTPLLFHPRRPFTNHPLPDVIADTSRPRRTVFSSLRTVFASKLLLPNRSRVLQPSFSVPLKIYLTKDNSKRSSPPPLFVTGGCDNSCLGTTAFRLRCQLQYMLLMCRPSLSLERNLFSGTIHLPPVFDVSLNTHILATD